MPTRRKYRKRKAQIVVALRLDLETDGFSYHKWGHDNRCKQGDWIVDNGGDVYTIDAETFAQTYEQKSQGIYEKVTPVWAARASEGGTIQTKEGATNYRAGDYLVSNQKDGSDAYAVSKDTFERMYVAIEDD